HSVITERLVRHDIRLRRGRVGLEFPFPESRIGFSSGDRRAEKEEQASHWHILRWVGGVCNRRRAGADDADSKVRRRRQARSITGHEVSIEQQIGRAWRTISLINQVNWRGRKATCCRLSRRSRCYHYAAADRSFGAIGPGRSTLISRRLI